MVLWGFSPIGTRFMVGNHNQSLNPSAFTAIRFTIATLFLAPLALPGLRGWSRRDWLYGALCGVVGVTGYSLPAAIGQYSVSAGLTGLLDGAEPLMIVLFTALHLRRRPTAWTIIASCIALAGILLLARQSGPLLGRPLGIALVLLGAALWGLYCVMVPPLIRRRGALPVTFVATLAGTIPMLAAGAPHLGPMLHNMDLTQWEVTAALAIGTSVFAMLSWNAGSAGLGAERAGWFLYLLPVVSLIGGAILLGEPIKAVELLGGGLILLAVFLAQR